MKRTAPLPANLAPWFTLEKGTGVVHCKKCPSVFLGQQATDLALAKHVSTHIGAAKTERNTAVTKSVDDSP